MQKLNHQAMRGGAGFEKVGREQDKYGRKRGRGGVEGKRDCRRKDAGGWRP
jgi:hypothetical protein